MDPFHYRPQLKPEQEEPEPYITNPNIHNSTNKNHQSSSTSNNNYLCRQASTRWIPTSEQIRILRDLYYNYGIRSPNSDEIQRISAMLRQYGKIEGKNVFYWFQNHKARERHKKRFTADVNNNGLIYHQGHCNGLVPDAPVGLVRPHAGVSGPSSSGSFHGVAQQENSSYIGTMITERNFIVNGKGETSQMGTNNGGLALELELNTTNPWLLQRQAEQQLASATIAVTRELETLQLFPVKTEIPFQSNLPTKQINNLLQEPSFHFPQFSNNSSFYYQQWQQNQEAANDQHLYEIQPSTTSLELTLGSYLFYPPM